MTDKQWTFVPFDVGAVQDLSRRANVSPVVAQLLLRRGISQPEQAQQFLEAKLTATTTRGVTGGSRGVRDHRSSDRCRR
jgi:hypothetical protein